MFHCPQLVTCPSTCIHVGIKIGQDIFIVGGLSFVSPSPTVLWLIPVREYMQSKGIQATTSDGSKPQTFYGVMIKDNLYFSKNYARVKK